MHTFAVYQTTVGFIRLDYRLVATSHDENTAAIVSPVLQNLHISLERPKDFGTKNHYTEVIYTQLTDYFEGKRKYFDYPIDTKTLLESSLQQGSDFQKKVWTMLGSIPYGHSLSYKDVATMTGSPNAARAVGAACHNNPLPILIPCHRVIGSNGSITGYAFGIHCKQVLLDLERSNS